MARPKTPHPTPAELEVLKLLWERGPLTVREVLEIWQESGDERAYTSVMSLLNVMADKGLLDRTPEGRAFRYAPQAERQSILGGLIGDVWKRAFGGSASTLVAHLLEEANPTADELAAIREMLSQYEHAAGESHD